jgi:hypothetical protein
MKEGEKPVPAGEAKTEVIMQKTFTESKKPKHEFRPIPESFYNTLFYFSGMGNVIGSALAEGLYVPENQQKRAPSAEVIEEAVQRKRRSVSKGRDLITSARVQANDVTCDLRKLQSLLENLPTFTIGTQTYSRGEAKPAEKPILAHTQLTEDLNKPPQTHPYAHRGAGLTPEEQQKRQEEQLRQQQLQRQQQQEQMRQQQLQQQRLQQQHMQQEQMRRQQELERQQLQQKLQQEQMKREIEEKAREEQKRQAELKAKEEAQKAAAEKAAVEKAAAEKAAAEKAAAEKAAAEKAAAEKAAAEKAAAEKAASKGPGEGEGKTAEAKEGVIQPTHAVDSQAGPPAGPPAPPPPPPPPPVPAQSSVPPPPPSLPSAVPQAPSAFSPPQPSQINSRHAPDPSKKTVLQPQSLPSQTSIPQPGSYVPKVGGVREYGVHTGDVYMPHSPWQARYGTNKVQDYKAPDPFAPGGTLDTEGLKSWQMSRARAAEAKGIFSVQPHRDSATFASGPSTAAQQAHGYSRSQPVQEFQPAEIKSFAPYLVSDKTKRSDFQALYDQTEPYTYPMAPQVEASLPYCDL